MIKPSIALDDAAEVDIVIEAVFERMDLKQDIVRKLDTIARPGAAASGSGRPEFRETLQVIRDDNIFAIGDCACCVPLGARAPVPPRAQSAHQMAAMVYKSIVNRVLGKPSVKFRYQDFGSLVNLSEYGTFGNLFDRLSGRSVKVEGFIARTMYRSLYRMHLAAVHGPVKAGLDLLTGLITQRSEARIKLH